MAESLAQRLQRLTLSRRDMRKTIQRVQAIREGGHTERAHTIPHHGSYSVAAHTWHVVTLLLLLHPQPSTTLLKAAHFHDVFERWAGDLPGHAKYWHCLELGKVHAALEGRIEKILDLSFGLTDGERAWLAGCDILEFYLWCCDQEALGNRHVVHVKANVIKWLSENKDRVPEEIHTFVATYSWQRTSDIGYWNEKS